MNMQMSEKFNHYCERLASAVSKLDLDKVEILTEEVFTRLLHRKQIFLCGNGGSAANAIHIANDYLYGIVKQPGAGARVEALPANQAIVTCLANDIGYSEIYSEQIRVKAEKDDLLIVLSGSGNSENIVSALQTANKIGVTTAAILGFSGGKAKGLAKVVIHAEINDMQISEDIQTMILHHIMQVCFVKIRESE